MYYLPVFRKIQVYILIVASFIFVSYSGFYNAGVLLASVLINSVFRIIISRSSTAKKRYVAVVGVVFNVLYLGVFKYSHMLIDTFRVSNTESMLLYNLLLPLGISFYTFQAISMLVDELKTNEKQSIWELVKNSILYLSFFPNVVSGPLISNEEFSSNLYDDKVVNCKTIKAINWKKLVKYLIIGYFLKMCIADNLQNETFYMQAPYYLQYSPIQLILMMVAYSCQLFADFAGYSYIALGVALLFGFELPINFNYPYISQSIGEFWRRWHISLSSWIKKYIYIPLGGNRKGKLRTYFNLFIIMTICGMWHGADWKYLLWGVIYGLLLAIERIVLDKKAGKIKVRKAQEDNTEKITKDRSSNSNWGEFNVFKIAVIFIIVSWLWLFFKLESFSDVLNYSRSMIMGWNIWNCIDLDVCVMSIFYCFPVVIYHIWYLIRDRISSDKIKEIIIGCMYIGMIIMIAFNRGSESAFVYFQF